MHHTLLTVCFHYKAIDFEQVQFQDTTLFYFYYQAYL